MSAISSAPTIRKTAHLSLNNVLYKSEAVIHSAPWVDFDIGINIEGYSQGINIEEYF